MSDAAIYYRHSGRFTPLALVSTIGASVVVAAVLGFAYGIAVFYMPLIYLNALLCVGLGFLIGRFVRWLAVRQHIRNLPVIAFAGLLAGLAAEYAAFVGWLLPVLQWSGIVYEPLGVAMYLDLALDKGVWGLSKGDVVKGPFLLLIWIIEGVTLVGIATYQSVANLKATPYCEPCGRWLHDSAFLGPFEPIADVESMRAGLERGDFAVLSEVTPLQEKATDGRFAQIELRDCPSCDDTAVMTVRNLQVVVDKEGNASTSSVSVVDNLLIDRPSSELIKQVAAQAQAESADASTGQDEDAAPGEAPGAAESEADFDDAAPADAAAAGDVEQPKP